MTLRWFVAGLVAALFAISSQTQSAHAQSAFVEEVTSIEQGATSVAVADLDGDGDLDAWFGYQNESRIYHWTDGAWTDSGQLLGEDVFIQDVALGDFDADGDVDAVTLDFDNVTIWINAGGKQAGTESVFASRISFPTDLGGRLVLGDLNNDDDLDIFFTRGGDRPDLVWLNDGDGNFTDSGLLMGDSFGSDVALGDIDGDDDLDAVIATAISSLEEPTPLNEIWLNTTNHITESSALFLDSGLRLGERGANAVALADVDGDGDLDVWLGGLSGDNTLWINQGGSQAGTEGTFVQSIQSLGGQTRDSAFADVDGDGDLDILVARLNGVGSWLNQGGIQAGTSGQFAFRGQTLLVNAERIAVGNLNGDTYPDLLIAPYAGPGRTSYWINGDQAAVDIYTGLRDDLMRSSLMGRHYISLYEQFTGEIVLLTLTNPTLNANMWAGLDLWKPTIDNLVTGSAGVPINENQIKSLDAVLENLELVGSEALQTAIATEREALGRPLDDFVGMSIGQASFELLGDPNYLLFMPTVAQASEESATVWTVRPRQQDVGLCIIICMFIPCRDITNVTLN